MALVATTRWEEHLIIVDEQEREQWGACVPAWLRDRRDEVIAAMKAVNRVIVEFVAFNKFAVVCADGYARLKARHSHRRA